MPPMPRGRGGAIDRARWCVEECGPSSPDLSSPTRSLAPAATTPLYSMFHSRTLRGEVHKEYQPAPTAHEDMGVPRMWGWGMQVSSPASVLTVNTPLTPSESHENGF